MVTLLSANACLEAEKEAAMKQAQSASKAAESFMSSGGMADKDLKDKLQQRETGTIKRGSCRKVVPNFCPPIL